MRFVRTFPFFSLCLFSACTTWPMPPASAPPEDGDAAGARQRVGSERPAAIRRVFVCGWGVSECEEIRTLVLGRSAKFFLEGRFTGAQPISYSSDRHGLLQPDGDARLLDVRGTSVWATPFTFLDAGLQSGETNVRMCDAAFKVRIGGAK